MSASRDVDAIADHYVEDDGHHGTPLQRERAAAWGAELAMGSSPKSAKLPASEVAARFEVELPGFVAPDA